MHNKMLRWQADWTQRIYDTTIKSVEVYKKAEDWGVIECISHPVTYADTLLRIGFEPLPPIERKSLIFSTPYLALPGILPYIEYLRLSEGLPDLYRCVLPCLFRKYCYSLGFHYAESRIPPEEGPPPSRMLVEGRPELHERFTQENLLAYAKREGYVLLCRIAGTVASHPFQVIAVRTMASAVGREGPYRNPVACCREIFKTEGVFGYFSGVIPRIIGDVAFVSTSAFVYLSIIHSIQAISWRLSPDTISTLQSIASVLANVVASPYALQFNNISDLMIVNGSSLELGNPPYTPLYSGWLDCWSNLRRDKLSKTSVGVFNRYYTGEYVVDEESRRMRPVGEHFGPTFIPVIRQDLPYLLKDFYQPLPPAGTNSRLLMAKETERNRDNDILVNALHTTFAS